MPTLKFGDLAFPGLWFGFLYWVITQHFSPGYEYRDVVANAACLIGALVLAWHWFFGGPIRPLRKETSVYLGIFFTLGLLSSWLAADPGSAFSQLRLYFSVFLFGLGVHSWCEQLSRRTMIGLLLVFCLVHLCILVVVIAHASGLVQGVPGQAHEVPFHSNIRHVAHHGMVSACAGLTLFFVGGHLRLAGIVLAGISIFGLIFLGQRGGVLGLAVYVIAAAQCLPLARKKIFITGFVTLTIALVAVYVLDRQGISNNYSGSIVERVRTDARNTFASGTGRIEIWKTSVYLGLERPWLGHGPDGFRTSPEGRSYTGIAQSHNLLIQAFVELGLPGMMLVVIALYRVVGVSLAHLIDVKHRKRDDPLPAMLFAIIVGFLAQSMVEGLFYHSVSLLIFSMLLPLTMAAMRDSGNRSTSFAG